MLYYPCMLVFLLVFPPETFCQDPPTTTVPPTAAVTPTTTVTPDTTNNNQTTVPPTTTATPDTTNVNQTTLTTAAPNATNVNQTTPTTVAPNTTNVNQTTPTDQNKDESTEEDNLIAQALAEIKKTQRVLMREDVKLDDTLIRHLLDIHDKSDFVIDQFAKNFLEVLYRTDTLGLTIVKLLADLNAHITDEFYNYMNDSATKLDAWRNESLVLQNVAYESMEANLRKEANSRSKITKDEMKEEKAKLIANLESVTDVESSGQKFIEATDLILKTLEAHRGNRIKNDDGAVPAEGWSDAYALLKEEVGVLGDYTTLTRDLSLDMNQDGISSLNDMVGFHEQLASHNWIMRQLDYFILMTGAAGEALAIDAAIAIFQGVVDHQVLQNQIIFAGSGVHAPQALKAILETRNNGSEIRLKAKDEVNNEIISLIHQVVEDELGDETNSEPIEDHRVIATGVDTTSLVIEDVIPYLNQVRFRTVVFFLSYLSLILFTITLGLIGIKALDHAIFKHYE